MIVFYARVDVPEGWYHATESLDETIAVAGQSYIKGPVTKKLRLSLQVMAARSQQESYDKLIKLEDFYRDELQEAHRGIAGMAASKLRDMGRNDEAYRRLDEAIAFNPKHADSYTNKGQFMLLDAMCVPFAIYCTSHGSTPELLMCRCNCLVMQEFTRPEESGAQGEQANHN